MEIFRKTTLKIQEEDQQLRALFDPELSERHVPERKLEEAVQKLSERFDDAVSSRISELATGQDPDASIERVTMNVFLSESFRASGWEPPNLSTQDDMETEIRRILARTAHLKRDGVIGPPLLLLQQVLLAISAEREGPFRVPSTIACLRDELVRVFWETCQDFILVAARLADDLDPDLHETAWWVISSPIIFLPAEWMIHDKDRWGLKDAIGTPMLFAMMRLLSPESCPRRLKPGTSERTKLVQNIAAFGSSSLIVDLSGRGVSHMAAQYKLPDVIAALAETKGVTVYNTDDQDRSVLHYTSARGLKDSSMLLLNVGFWPNQVDNWGRTPLHLSAQNGHTDVVRLLLAHPDTDPNIKSNSGRCPLGEAISAGHPDTYREFLSHPRVNFNVVQANGYTFLHEAFFSSADTSSQVAMIRDLAPKCVGVINQQTGDQLRTALCLATLAGHAEWCKEVVEILLSIHIIDASISDDYLCTPLHYAALNGHLETCRLLCVRMDSGILERNEDGKTPADLAGENGHVEVLELLTEQQVRFKELTAAAL